MSAGVRLFGCDAELQEQTSRVRIILLACDVALCSLSLEVKHLANLGATILLPAHIRNNLQMAS